MKSDLLVEFYEKHKLVAISIVYILFLLISSKSMSKRLEILAFTYIILGLFIGIVVIISYKFISFYQSDARLDHKFNRFHGGNFISLFYRIYFPVIILYLIVTVLVLFAYAPEPFGLGIIDYQKVTPFGKLQDIVGGLVLGLGIIALSDYRMKQNNLHYSRKNKTSLRRSIMYAWPLIGIYFGATFLLRFVITQIFGPGSLIPDTSFPDPHTLMILAARAITFLSNIEINLLIIAFITYYVSIEVFLRGIVAKEAQGYGLGPSAMIFIPAVLQAVGFTDANMMFRDPIIYVYTLFDLFLLGIILGIILWRTGNFAAVLLSALLIRFLDPRLELQSLILHKLPKAFGDFDLYDNQVTIADTISVYLSYFQIAIVITAPFMILLGYEEVLKILRGVYKGFKEQWFGYIVLVVTFMIIDFVFEIVVSIFGIVLGILAGILMLSFILSIFLQVLPEPTEMPIIRSLWEDQELPLDVTSDLKYIDRRKKWIDYPVFAGLIGSMGYLYFLFLSGSYRQISVLQGLDIAKYIFFLVILPTILIGSSAYLYSRAIASGFFFADNWRSSLFTVTIVVFIVLILIWTSASATTFFRWRNVPFFILFALYIWPRGIKDPVVEFSKGLSQYGRYATFKWVEAYPETFEPVFQELLKIDSDQIQAGTYILGAKLELIDALEIVSVVTDESSSRGELTGSLIALGILNHTDSESLLLGFLDHEDVEIKKAAYWSLGRIATSRSLRKMAKTLEENPIKSLVPIAEKAILSIDPNFPLAGIRDSIKIEV